MKITPQRLMINDGGTDTYWHETSDLADGMVRLVKESFDVTNNAEGGYVLVALNVDGSFDQVITSMAPGTGSDPRNVLLEAREAIDVALRGVTCTIEGGAE